MDRIDLDGFLARLNEFDALRTDDTINTGTVDRIRPQLATEWPAQLDSSVRGALISAGIQQPYQHQADAIIKSLDGDDVVMESPTASGKNLGVHRADAPLACTQRRLPRFDDLSDQSAGV